MYLTLRLGSCAADLFQRRCWWTCGVCEGAVSVRIVALQASITRCCIIYGLSCCVTQQYVPAGDTGGCSKPQDSWKNRKMLRKMLLGSTWVLQISMTMITRAVHTRIITFTHCGCTSFYSVEAQLWSLVSSRKATSSIQRGVESFLPCCPRPLPIRHDSCDAIASSLFGIYHSFHVNWYLTAGEGCGGRQGQADRRSRILLQSLGSPPFG